VREGQDSDYSHEKKNCTGSLIELQGTGGLPYQFNYRGNVYNALLLFPLLVVLGDTESHDRLCGRYNSHGSGVARLCRHCKTPRSETDNVDYDWDHILPEEVQSVIDTQVSKLYPSIQFETPFMKARKIGKALGHQRDRNLPRTYFPNGVTGGTKLAGHEMKGVILVLLILCKMTDTRKMLFTSKYLEEHHLRGWIKLFESMLVWRWWLKLPSVPVCSTCGDTGIRVLDAQTTEALPISCETAAWEQIVDNQVSFMLAFPQEPA
jgi:hypothetical protein